MPKLPDDSVLGGLPSANSGRPIASLDLSAPAKAMESVAQGVKDLGKGIASGLNSIADRNKEDDELVALKAKSGFATDLVALDKEEAGQNDPAELAKFPERRQALFQKYADQIPNAKTKQRWTYEMAPKIAQWGGKTQGRIDTIEKDKFFAEANGNIELMRELAIDPEVDPETRDTALGVVNDYIDEMKSKGYLSEQEAEARRKKWGDSYAWDRVKMLPPEQRAYAVGGLEGAIIGRESGGRPGIVNDYGYAGLFQYGAPRLQTLGVYSPGDSEDLSRWSKSGRDAAGKWSGSFNIPGFPQVKTLQDFLANPDAQRKVYELDNAYMDKEITSRGLDQYVGQTVGGVLITRDGIKAMIHLGGAGGAKAALDSGGRTNATDANGSTLLSYAAMASRSDGGVANILPPDKRQELRDLTYRELEQKRNASDQAQRVETTTVKSLIEDDRGSIMATGKPLDVLTEERVRSVMGEHAAEAFKQDRFYAQRYWEKTNDMDGLPAEAIRARLSQLDPAKNGEAGKPGFGVASGYHSMAEKRAQAILDERAKDPAAAADRQKDMEEVKQGADLASAPQSYVPLVRRRMAVQERLGVPAQNRMPLTNAEATAIFKPVATALPGQEKDALEQTVKLLQVALGGDKDLIDAALEQGLKQAHVEKNTREIAARILRKIGMGETVQRSDAEAVTEARKQDAQASAASAILGATREAPAGPGVTASQESGVEMVGQRLAESGPRQSSMTRDELAQLWSMPSNKKMLESYTKTFGPDVVKRALEARPKDWDANLYKRHQSGTAQSPKRQLQFGAGSTGVFEQMRQQRDGAGAP